MKVLITGITGMIGSHFAETYRKSGAEVYGIARDSAQSRLLANPDPNIIRCDITDRDNLEAIIAELKPDIVIHTAAQAFNGSSWKMPNLTFQTNIIGTFNLLDSCRKHIPKAKILLACSSAEYGPVPIKECPIKEERLLRPVSPYGISKVATENLGYQHFSNYGMNVYLPRPFIHVGTGHPPATAIQNFARQLALIKAGKLEPVVKVGNLETARDFIDVRDGVRAMIMLLKKGKPGEPVNICTGKAYKISEILDMLIEIADIKVKIIKDKSFKRLSDEPLLLGDNSKLNKLGFKAKYDIKETLTDVMNDWIKRVEEGE